MTNTITLRGGRKQVLALDLHPLVQVAPQIGTWVYDFGFALTAVVTAVKLPQIALWFTTQSRLVRRVRTLGRALNEANAAKQQLRADSETLRATADNLRTSFQLVRDDVESQKRELQSFRVKFAALESVQRSLISFARACMAKLTEHGIPLPEMPADVRETLQ